MPARELENAVVGLFKSGQFQTLKQLFIGLILINITYHRIYLGGLQWLRTRQPVTTSLWWRKEEARTKVGCLLSSPSFLIHCWWVFLCLSSPWPPERKEGSCYLLLTLYFQNEDFFQLHLFCRTVLQNYPSCLFCRITLVLPDILASCSFLSCRFYFLHMLF